MSSLFTLCYNKLLGALHVLVNNAGQLQRAEFVSSSVDIEKELFNVNVFGITNICRVTVKHWSVANLLTSISIYLLSRRWYAGQRSKHFR